ncbi:hypothetical protein ABH922_004823 [Rhodococcus sp. 27YEA15]|uniref:hypothetical protein n=1 Tax=Rhodococcus sp. 27YEA15 TaxID=3156259 RepID=UPI003C7DEFD2
MLKGLRISLLLLSTVTLVGCVPDAQNGENNISVPPPRIEYANVWSAQDGFDLFSRGSELIRATREAGYMSFTLGIEKSFPGYESLIQDGLSNRESELNSVFKGGRSPAGQSPVTNYFHIVDLVESDHSVSATVCLYTIQSIENSSDRGEVFSTATYISLENSEASPGPPGLIDRDIAAHDAAAKFPPDWNVFGTWRAEQLRVLTADEVPRGCTQWWSERFPEYVKRTPDSRTLVPPEGYVPPVMPVAVQYPEWIGPGDVS